MRRKLLTLLLAIATILQAIPMNIIAEQTENDYGVVGAYKAYSINNKLYEPKGDEGGVANDVIYIKKNNDNDASKGMPAYCFNATKSIVDVYDSTPDFGDLTEPMPTYTKINGGINNKFVDLADNEILNNNSDLVSAVLKVIYNGYRENDGNRVEEIKNAYKNAYGDTVSDVEIYAATQKAIWYYTDGVKEFELNDDRIGKSITTKVLRLYRFLIGKEDHGLGLTLKEYTGAQTLDLYMPDRGQKDNALPYQNLLGTDLVDKKGSPDVKKYNITVKKVDEEDNALLAGATLELKSEDNIIYRWKTNTTENNKLSNPRTFYLQPGRYTLSEVSAPEGYRKAEPKTFTVGENGKVNGATEIVMTNKKIPVMSIQVSKKWQDENGGEYNDTDFLNVKIKLKADDKDALDASGNNIEPILLLKNNKWTYEFKNLPVYHTGKENLENEKIKYTVEELDIPEGFEWTVGRDTVITGNGNEKNEISLVNKKKVEPEEPKVQNEAHIHKIQVNKTWSELNKKSKKPVYFELWKVVDGVESKVIDSDLGGGKLENPVKLNEMTSSVAWTNVYVNEELTKKNFVFKVKEVDDMGNPWEDKENGYSKEDTKIIEVVNPTAKLFTVTNTYKKVDNEKNITISKVKIGGTELKDAKIEIRNESGDQLAKGKIDGAAGDLKWTSTETAKEIELKPGTYTFYEEAAPEGYQKVTELKFKVDESGNVSLVDGFKGLNEDKTPATVTAKAGKLIITDKAKAKKQEVVVSKVSLSDDETKTVGVVGASIQIFEGEKAEGNPIHSWKTDGKDHTIPNLEVGKKYTFHEETAPTGLKAVTDFVFTVDEKGAVKLEKTSTTGEVKIEEGKLVVTDAIDYKKVVILSCQHICYTYEKVFQNTCYFIENYKWISQGVKLCVP